MNNQPDFTKEQILQHAAQRKLNAMNDLRMYRVAIRDQAHHIMEVIEKRQDLRGLDSLVVIGALELKAAGADYGNFVKLATAGNSE